jgi:hypothetical protein
VPAAFADAIQQPPQRGDPLGADREEDVLVMAARAACPAKYPASMRAATRPPARARSGRAASARRSRSGAAAEPGPVAMNIAVTTGPGRNWASLWKPLIDSLGPVLGEDPRRPFNPHDDRILNLGLHHHINTGIGYDVIIDAWWQNL